MFRHFRYIQLEYYDWHLFKRPQSCHIHSCSTITIDLMKDMQSVTYYKQPECVAYHANESAVDLVKAELRTLRWIECGGELTCEVLWKIFEAAACDAKDEDNGENSEEYDDEDTTDDDEDDDEDSDEQIDVHEDEQRSEG